MSGPRRDLHSGNDGGVFSEPMADLVQLLGSLHGPGGKISVPGYHNNVRPQLMDLAWKGLEKSEEFSMSSYRCVARLTHMIRFLAAFAGAFTLNLIDCTDLRIVNGCKCRTCEN